MATTDLNECQKLRPEKTQTTHGMGGPRMGAGRHGSTAMGGKKNWQVAT